MKTIVSKIMILTNNRRGRKLMNCIWEMLFALALLPAIFGSEDAQAAKQPNLIVIMTDDLGYADVGFNGCKDIPTPNIDCITQGEVGVPLYYYWKGHIEGGRTINQIVANYDMMATFADLLNVKLPKEKHSISYLPDDYREEKDLIAKYPKKSATLKEILIEECSGDLKNGWFDKEERVMPRIVLNNTSFN